MGTDIVEYIFGLLFLKLFVSFFNISITFEKIFGLNLHIIIRKNANLITFFNLNQKFFSETMNLF